jgi:twinkle protein
MVKPLPAEELGNSPKKIYGWLAARGITSDTADKFGLLEDTKYFRDGLRQAIGFPYKQGDQTYAIKWRSIEDKSFTQTGSAQTFWLIDYVTKGEPLYIVEGEADALACHQAGIKAVSIPNGAPAQIVEGRIDPREDRKFQYIWQAKDIIDVAPRIVLAVDNDAPGKALAGEIARRVGRARCWQVEWPGGCKDANDVLRTLGADALKEALENATPWPVKGLYEAASFSDQVLSLYDKGMPSGESTGFPEVDDIYTVAPGMLTIATGSPGSGKSAFIDNIMVNIARSKDWKFAMCSFENPPSTHVAKLAAIYAQRPFFDGPTPRMSRTEAERAMAWVNEHFVFLHQADGSLSSMDGIIDLAKAAVMRYGVRGLVIDPINYVGRNPDQSETDWVSDMLTQLKLFATSSDAHVWLVAHPTKMQRKQDGSYPVPTGYDIAGSAHYFNKADMGISVHREDRTSNKSALHVWKSRFSWMGKVGQTDLTYEVSTGSFLAPYRGTPGAPLAPKYSCF